MSFMIMISRARWFRYAPIQPIGGGFTGGIIISLSGGMVRFGKYKPCTLITQYFWGILVSLEHQLCLDIQYQRFLYI